MRTPILATCLFLAACGSKAPPPMARPEAPPVPPVTDLVSPAAASGFTKTHGLDWPAEKSSAPGKTSFKNVPVLGELPGERLMLAMQSMEPNLGVGCDHCHDGHDFAADTKDPKKMARVMITMNHDIDTRFFGGKTNVTCYTCHRGDSTPEPFTATKPVPPWPMPALSAADAAKPAKEVYKNLKVLGDMPAARLEEVMGAFSGALGVGCIHCHDPGNWADDDKPAKNRAREMMGMVGAIGQTHFSGGKNPIRCTTCHRGDPIPVRVAGPMLTLHAALADGTAAPRVMVVVGPPGFAPPTRDKLREALHGPEGEHAAGVPMYMTTEGELGRFAPGSYSLCTVTLPADRNPAADPNGGGRPVTCAPITVAPAPDVQSFTRQLSPL